MVDPVTVGIILAFIASETLPFIKAWKANGLTHACVNLISDGIERLSGARSNPEATAVPQA